MSLPSESLVEYYYGYSTRNVAINKKVVVAALHRRDVLASISLTDRVALFGGLASPPGPLSYALFQ
jgi:hypothetical protein